MIDDAMVNEPDEWRFTVEPHEDNRAEKLREAVTKKRNTETAEYANNEFVSDKLLLNKVRFASYKKLGQDGRRRSKCFV